MPNFLGGVANAGANALGGGIVGAGINMLEHAFGLGGQPKEDPITAQSRRLALQAQQGQMDFARSVPMSDPSEMAALSQDRGMLGAAQRNQQQQMMGSWNPSMGTGGLSDMLRNLGNSQVGQQMSLQESHLMNALHQRRAALTEAANSGGRVAGPTYQPQSDLPQLLGSIAHQIAYQQGRNKGGGASTTGVPGTPGVGPAPGVILGGGGQPGYTPQMPGNFPQQQAPSPAVPPDTAGTDALTGGLPSPQFMQPQPGPTGGMTPTAPTWNPQVPQQAFNWFNQGPGAVANQIRQSFLRF